MAASNPPIGVGFTPLETRRDVVLHVAARAEQLGHESFHPAEGWGHDAAVLLTEVAVRTTRIRLETGVLNIWGRSPATLAMLATSLQEVSGGRFTLGWVRAVRSSPRACTTSRSTPRWPG
jgi:alkanesulfonate monooxygenase SsuD/methylene tetrahydromethanopterin reductase-like flavin-dependent oxidoreductase (luciferase family)